MSLTEGVVSELTGNRVRALLPREAWMPLFASLHDLEADQVTAVCDGRRDTRVFPAAVAVELVTWLTDSDGFAVASVAVGDDQRSSVRTALRSGGAGSLQAPVRSTDVAVERMATMLQAGNDYLPWQMRFALGPDEVIEVLCRVCDQDDPLDRVTSMNAVVSAMLSRWAHEPFVPASGVPAQLLACDRLADEPFESRALITAAVLGAAPACCDLVDDVELLRAAASTLAPDSTSDRRVPALRAQLRACRGAVAAALFEATGDVSLLGLPFGAGSPASMDVAAWNTCGSTWGMIAARQAAQPLGRYRPIDAAMAAWVGAGTHEDAAVSVLAMTSPTFPAAAAVSMWSSQSTAQEDLAKGFVDAAVGRFGHRWSADEVMAALESVPRFAEVLWRVLPDWCSRRAGAEAPEVLWLLVDASMRAIGLQEWALSAPEVLSTVLATNAPAHASVSWWETVWTLLPNFAGTASELAELASVTALD